MRLFKSIITGGAGFIGSNLTDHLVGIGHKVIVLDNFVSGKKSNLSHHKKKDVKIIKIDISKSKNLDKHFSGVDYVFHLAGLAEIIPSIKNPKKYFTNNVLGTLNVVEASKKAKIKKFIYAASSSCYGTPKSFPTSETNKIDLKHPYAVTKFIGEEIVMNYASSFNMPNISCRFFNVYGPRNPQIGEFTPIIAKFAKQYRDNVPLTIVGDGTQKRDFTHVYDICEGLYALSKGTWNGEIFNLGTIGNIKIASLIEMSLGASIGAITFTGSIIAFLKLRGLMSGNPITFIGQHYLNLLLGLSVVVLIFYLCKIQLNSLFWLIIVVSFLLGVLLIIPIGGADMPVVISMLNSYSGWAAAGIGFTLENTALIITGALVGSSGAILSYIMCKGMNRSFFNVILGGFGGTDQSKAKTDKEQKPVKSGNADDAAFLRPL